MNVNSSSSDAAADLDISTIRSAVPSAAPEHIMSSDDELELALPEVSGLSTPEETDSVIAPLPVPQSFPIAQPSFKPPPNPSIPQDLAVIAELVNTFQAVGSLPPLTISAAEKRKQVEASIRAKMEALKNSKGKGKEVDGGAVSAGNGVAVAESSGAAEPGQAECGSLEADAAMRSELDRFVGNPLSGEVEDDSSSDSDSSSEFLSDDSDEDEEEEGQEFVFSNSPAPSPRKRPMKFEYIEDDEEPISADPIMSANEAPLPPVPQPPFAQLPKEETLSLAGEVVSWMRERQVEAWWEARAKAEAVKEDITRSIEGLAADAPAGESEPSGSAEVIPFLSADDGMEEGEVEESADEPSSSTHPIPTSEAKPNEVIPRFASSGTVVIRAMQQHPGQEGWLEEGSVVCHPDGRVLGFVSDTFGPLTSPFYSVRLPPPPFPLPSLPIGTRLSYPTNPQYRSFVNMLAVRDPRFKGSDASNIHDEEVGEEEAEWSDDEMEAEAKKRKKNKRSESKAGHDKGGWAPGAFGASGSISHSLPTRPHFDYVPEDASDAASFYGGAGEEMDDGMVSEAGSSASRRPAPMPYDLDEPGETGPIPFQAEEGQGGGEGKRGRGQGRQRGRGRDGGGGRGKGGERGGRGGRGGGQGDRGGGRGGRGGGGGGGGGDRGGRGGDRGGRGRGGQRGGGAGPSVRPNFGLPQKPSFDPMSIHPDTPHDPIASFGLPPPPASLPTPPSSAVIGYDPSVPQSHSYANQPVLVDQYRPQQRPPPQQQPYSPHGQHFSPYPQQQQQQQQFQPPYHQQQHAQAFSYSPHHYNPPSFHPQQAPEAHGAGGGPAINPRFAAKYQQMQLMSHLAAWQGGGGQGGGAGQDGGGGGGPYGYPE